MYLDQLPQCELIYTNALADGTGQPLLDYSGSYAKGEFVVVADDPTVVLLRLTCDQKYKWYTYGRPRKLDWTVSCCGLPDLVIRQKPGFIGRINWLVLRDGQPVGSIRHGLHHGIVALISTFATSAFIGTSRLYKGDFPITLNDKLVGNLEFGTKTLAFRSSSTVNNGELALAFASGILLAHAPNFILG